MSNGYTGTVSIDDPYPTSADLMFFFVLRWVIWIARARHMHLYKPTGRLYPPQYRMHSIP